MITPPDFIYSYYYITARKTWYNITHLFIYSYYYITTRKIIYDNTS
jgi:hypothetical protein